MSCYVIVITRKWPMGVRKQQQLRKSCKACEERVCPLHITPSVLSPPIAVESESESVCRYKGVSTAYGSSLTHILPGNMPSPPTCQMRMKAERNRKEQTQRKV
jgi:hypothetical protein